MRVSQTLSGGIQVTRKRIKFNIKLYESQQIHNIQEFRKQKFGAVIKIIQFLQSRNP